MAAAYKEVENSARIKYNSIYSKAINSLKNNPDLAEPAAEALVNKCIDEIILDVLAEYHRDVKLGFGYFYYDASDIEAEVNSSAIVFEDDIERKVEDIKCPNCARVINASRFAPHLEKCMRMGRNSSRIASRRIANNSKENSYSTQTDDDDDDDWSSGDKLKMSKKIETRKKREKPRKQPKGVKGSKEDAQEDESVTYQKLLTMVCEERTSLLSNVCGVKLENQKICMKPVKCSSHSEEERSSCRKLLQDNFAAKDNEQEIEECENNKLDNENSNSSSQEGTSLVDKEWECSKKGRKKK